MIPVDHAGADGHRHPSSIEDEAELTARGASLAPQLRKVVESDEWRKTVTTAADKIASASDENRIFPKNSHTLPDEIVSHYISEDDLTRIVMASRQSRSTAAEQLLLGGLFGLFPGACGGIWKVHSAGSLVILDGIDIASIIGFACALSCLVVLLLTSPREKDNTVAGICEKIRNRHKYTHK